MARLVCALVLLAVATCSASQSRVIGGSAISIQDRPWMVQVQSRLAARWTQTCAANILNRRYVLSAARCFSGPTFLTQFRRILAGTGDRNGEGQYSNIARNINHPSWDEERGKDGDISVVLLETPLDYSDAVQQATIVAPGSTIPGSYPAVLAGWGWSLENIPGVYAEVLRQANVITVDNTACADIYAEVPLLPYSVSSNMICTRQVSGRVGACVGDRGGSLTINNVVVGIISWGLGCTNVTYPNVHTAVSPYTNWIIETVV